MAPRDETAAAMTRKTTDAVSAVAKHRLETDRRGPDELSRILNRGDRTQRLCGAGDLAS